MKFAVCIYKLARYVLYVALPIELQRHIGFLDFTTGFQPWWHWQDSNLQPTGYKPKLTAVSICRAPYRTRTGKPSPWQGDILPIELMAHKHVLFIVPQEGLEPSTHGLRVRCATNCATEALVPVVGLEPTTFSVWRSCSTNWATPELLSNKL